MPPIKQRLFRRNSPLIQLPRPRIERELDGQGWYVIRGDFGWLCGSRRHALREFNDLVKIERTGSW
jgi:hypothetical protein